MLLLSSSILILLAISQVYENGQYGTFLGVETIILFINLTILLHNLILLVIYMDFKNK